MRVELPIHTLSSPWISLFSPSPVLTDPMMLFRYPMRALPSPNKLFLDPLMELRLPSMLLRSPLMMVLESPTTIFLLPWSITFFLPLTLLSSPVI